MEWSLFGLHSVFYYDDGSAETGLETFFAS